MTWGGAIEIILIALVTLPLAGLPLAIWLLFQYRRDTRKHQVSLREVSP